MKADVEAKSDFAVTTQERRSDAQTSGDRRAPATPAPEPPQYVLSSDEIKEIVEKAVASQLKGHFDEEQHRARTSSHLAYLLASIFAGTILLPYATVLILIHMGKTEAIQTLAPFFNVSLSATLGLVGAAVGFYFSRKR